MVSNRWEEAGETEMSQRATDAMTWLLLIVLVTIAIAVVWR